MSCPDLRPEAYTAEMLNSQLDDQMKQFLANAKKGLKVDSKKRRIYLSSIFKWFEEDFDSKGGVRKFIAPYSPESVKGSVTNTRLRVSYLDYDWG